mmetsp:Transcript_87982/g.246159  ORF Transcript_87982/g.246159 Transcript_87982/m.246159 type:complete len:272 (+) Transcript_87982:59-874(+)
MRGRRLRASGAALQPHGRAHDGVVGREGQRWEVHALDVLEPARVVFDGVILHLEARLREEDEVLRVAVAVLGGGALLVPHRLVELRLQERPGVERRQPSARVVARPRVPQGAIAALQVQQELVDVLRAPLRILVLVRVRVQPHDDGQPSGPRRFPHRVHHRSRGQTRGVSMEGGEDHVLLCVSKAQGGAERAEVPVRSGHVGGEKLSEVQLLHAARQAGVRDQDQGVLVSHEVDRRGHEQRESLGERRMGLECFQEVASDLLQEDYVRVGE